MMYGSPYHEPALARVVSEVYGGTPYNKVRTTIPRSTVDALIKKIALLKLPLDGKADGIAPTLRVYRAALRAQGYVEDSASYTDYEVQQALIAVCTGKLSHPAAEAIFGVPMGTLKRKQAALRDALHYNSNKDMQADKSEDGIKRITVQALTEGHSKRGPDPFLSMEEVALVGGIKAVKTQSGMAVSAKEMSKDLRGIVRAKGEALLLVAKTEKEKTRAKMMAHATCSRPYVQQLLRASDDALGVTGDEDPSIWPSPPVAPGAPPRLPPASPRATKKLAPKQKHAAARKHRNFIKVANKSIKRALAGNVIDDIDMRALIEALYDEHLGKGNRPLNMDVFNVDEKGMAPEGKYDKSFRSKLFKKYQGVPIKVVTNEHNAFWVTVSVTTCADGTVIPWMVLHRGGSETTTTMSMGLGADLPPNFIVTETPSGYQTQAEFEKVILQLRDYRVSQGRSHIPAFLFLDAHFSHWNTEAFAFARLHKIFPFFLRSNNSTGDQANDNGTNALIETSYSDALHEWRSKYPGVPYNKAWFNVVLAATWNKMDVIDKKNTIRVVKKSYQVTGCWPHVESSSLVTPNANDTDAVKVYKATLAATTKVALPLMTEARAAATRTALALLENKVVDGVVDAVRYVNVVTVTRMTEEEARKQGVGAITNGTRFAISAAALHYAQTSIIVPATQLRQELARHELEKKTKVPKQTGTLLNTSKGLIVSADVVAQGREKQKADAAAKVEKESKKRSAADKKLETMALNRRMMIKVKKMAARKPRDAWKKLSVAELWKAVAGFGGVKVAKERTNDAVAKIAEFLGEDEGDSDSDEGSDDSDGDSDDEGTDDSDDSDGDSEDEGPEEDDESGGDEEQEGRESKRRKASVDFAALAGGDDSEEGEEGEDEEYEYI